MAEDDIRKDEAAAADSSGDDQEKAKKKPKEPPIIHVIPQEFYGAALKSRVKVSVPKDEKEEKESKEAAKAARPIKPEKEPRPKSKGGGKKILLVVVGILLLVVIGFAAYYFLVMKKAPPAPVAPPKPVQTCGDGRCLSPETEQTCAADCKPAARCGDGSCQAEAGESKQTCPVDCGPPEPVCGDGKCELPETPQTCLDDCKPPEPVPALDTDSDGLSDDEETGIYGTNIYSPDTDGDSYVDLNELLNLFNPALPQPSSLPVNPGVLEYENPDQKYTLLQPRNWTVAVQDSGRSVTFLAPRGESIEIEVQDKTEGQGLMDWYLAQNLSIRSSEVQIFRTKQGYDHVISQDQLSAYVAVDGKIFKVTYSLADQLLIRYKATFKMMVNSIRYRP